jgi:penicillin amidase
MLRQWHGEMGREQIPAAIFNLWLNRLRHRLILDDLEGFENSAAQASALRDYVDFVTALQVKQMMLDRDYDWCDDRGTQAKEGCAEIAAASLQEALAELKKRHGKQSGWQWGSMHRRVFKHVPFSGVNGLDLVFERRIASPGSENSIDVASSRYTEADGFDRDFGATFRQVIAMAPGKVRHTYMNSTGQSGNPLSGHFDDMVAPFSRVEFFEMNAAGAANGESLLTLVPARQAAMKGR